MSWINSRKEHAHRISGEFHVVDGWVVNRHGHGHGHEIQRVCETVEMWGTQSRIMRVLTDDLACLILGVLEQAKQFGFTRRSRLSWVDETPNQLLLEVPATPESASAFLDQIDEWVINSSTVDLHRRLIVDVCFPA